ncbi:MAG: hypothetical protein PVF05_09370 [Gemmatimonadales bacterium]
MNDTTDRPADAGAGPTGVEENGGWWTVFWVIFVVLFATAFAALVHSLSATFG